jgi:metal-responsive CopG/Arc/MetJ family transcriptional regulator
MITKEKIGLSIDKKVIRKIDDIRGYTPRSTMVNVILEDVLGLADDNEQEDTN